jgi:hypothetical protein
MGSGSPIQLFIEPGKTWVFASALDWPGWARRGKSEELAVQALADYLPRYAPIVARSGLAPVAGTLVITERHPEQTVNADFGTLHEIAPSENRPLSAEEGARLAAILEAAWAAFDELAATAPATLRKGPRGGGRDTAQIVAHVQDAEEIYARRMGLPPNKTLAGAPEAVARRRAQLGAALREPASLVTPPKGWPPRFVARRTAWHVLDHLWEIEDKSE